MKTLIMITEEGDDVHIECNCTNRELANTLAEWAAGDAKAAKTLMQAVAMAAATEATGYLMDDLEKIHGKAVLFRKVNPNLVVKQDS
jgi:hypothetical protein